jgi:uncharacterized protein
MTMDVPSLILAAGGELVGKIRLQKIVYLLDQMGLESGFSYEYHHYGPYSEDLAEQVEDDVIFGYLDSEQRRRQSDGVPYVVYRSRSAGQGEALDRHLARERVERAVGEMQRRSATVLELAATMHWLAVMEGLPDWRQELIRRKGAKTQSGRDQQALELLCALGLPPAVGLTA